MSFARISSIWLLDLLYYSFTIIIVGSLASDWFRMPYKTKVLVVPPNDAEAILIEKIARAIGLPVISSGQTHGASLDKGKDIVSIIKKAGYKQVFVVEMPGLKAEAFLAKSGIKVTVIDHHHYTGLNRAKDKKTGRLLPSSLEQFLKLFKITSLKLKQLGFDSKLVLGIGILDKGYIWALQKNGYTNKDVGRVLDFHDELMSKLRNPKTEKRKQASAQRAWDSRKKWMNFYIVESHADIQLRPRLSLIVAIEKRKPVPLIIIEKKRKLIYVQESPYAMDLFKKFGGFTFGSGHNWGYRNDGKVVVGLKDVKEFIKTLL